MSNRRKAPREKDLTERYLSGNLDEDRVEAGQRFSARNKSAQQDKILRTAQLRADEQSDVDVESLPIGQVIQVYSLFSDVEHGGATYQCVVRKTLTKVSDTAIVVGDRVRFRPIEARVEAVTGEQAADGPAVATTTDAPAREGVIEKVLPRETVLTRAESFKQLSQHPIVANAQRMLIVASLRSPAVKWGLVDRMIIAALSGKLEPVVCLNKVDLASTAGSGDGEEPRDLRDARDALAHYATVGIRSVETSVDARVGLDALRDVLRDRMTVLAGHSGVGKSSLIRAIQPQLDLRVGDVSEYTDKGRHTTTSARRYALDIGGSVIDTPGVKVFGLWGVTRENLIEFFPDVEAGTAPEWRRQSYERIAASLPEAEE